MTENTLNIQWFPGHMARTKRRIKENLGLVDAVCEIVDARIPRSSRNPDLNSIAGTKPRLIILNKADLADEKVTGKWSDLSRTFLCIFIFCTMMLS